MTTIAYRDGTMAADTRAYRGNSIWLGSKTKIYKIKKHLVGVSSGKVGVANVLIKWYKDGMPDGLSSLLPDKCYIEFLAVSPDGEAMYMDSNLLPTYVTSAYYAVGSGSDFAMGAMAMGASPKESVKVAKLFDPFTNGKITVIKH